MADKARDAFRTISEVANWLDVPAHVLRFWESKFPQIKPVKRAGGRRYYRPADMELIGGIKKLLHDDGLTIRGVQKMIKEEGVKEISTLSPPLNMPSEEEAAARRKARRARRQARQAARTRTGETAERLTPPAPPSPPEEEGEAPFTHVEDAELVDGQDNVVQLSGRQDEESDDISTTTSEPEEAATEAPAVTSLPTTPELDPSPVLPEEPAADAQASFSLGDVSPADTEDALPESTENEQNVVQDTPDAAHAATAEPAQNVSLDPFDIGAVTATEAQRMRVKRLRKFRRLDVGTVFAGGSSDAVVRAHDKLQTLRDRLAIDLDRR